MSWEHTPPVIREDEDEIALKLDFAKRWAANPNGVLSIGYAMFPGDDNAGRAMQAAAWRHDPFVIAEFERLRCIDDDTEASVEDKFLTRLKADAATVDDAKVKLEYYKLEAQVLGIVKTQNNSVNLNFDNRKTQNVLLVPQSESIDDFKARFKKQQTELIANAKTVKSASN